MPRHELSYEEVVRIVELVKTTRFSEFRLKVGEIEVHLRRGNGAAPPGHEAAGPEPAGTAAHGAAAAQPVPPEKERQFPPGSVLVRSPMVGTFYRAPAPDAPAFVEVGSHVEPGATVCIIEVMKLMNSIAAEARGIVAEILVANGARVEAGEVLMAIRPDPEDG
jgi:acetyl-CoA carboxylase biotin carboxyl carrier protein